MIELIKGETKLNESEIKKICIWTKKDVVQINFLSLKELISKSTITTIARGNSNKIIGLGILTRDDQKYKKGSIEVTCLIVEPSSRRQFIGSSIISTLLKEAQSKNFYDAVCNVQKDNIALINLLISLNWSKNDSLGRDGLNDSHILYRKKINNNKFSDYLTKRMVELGLNNERLADLVGVSKQHINGLKNPIVGKLTKNISVKKLKDFAIVLSQTDKNAFSKYFEFKKNQRENVAQEQMKEWNTIWVKHWSFSKFLKFIEKDITLDKIINNTSVQNVFNFLLTITDLKQFSDKTIQNDEKLLSNNIENTITLLKKRTMLSEKPYEIWFIGENFKEQMNSDYIDEIADNILNHTVCYRFYTSIDDNISWKVLKNKIEIAFIEKFNINKEYYFKYWNNPSTRHFIVEKLSFANHLKIYGVPETMLFYKSKIYNATSLEAKGGINLGGEYNDITYFEMNSITLERIKSFVHDIYLNEQYDFIGPMKKLNENKEKETFLRDQKLTIVEKYPIYMFSAFQENPDIKKNRK